MRRSIFKAGVWTALGLATAFAVVSANSNSRRAVTAAPAAKATVANATANDLCTSPDACCARETKSEAVAAAPRAKKAVARKLAVRPAAPAPGVAGMVVGIDPETGELGMPSAVQMDALQGQIVPSDDFNRSTAGLQEVHHADGSVSIDVQGRFQEFAGVRILPNGKKVFGCSDDPKAASSIPAASGLEEK